jgi:hypothetical protein
VVLISRSHGDLNRCTPYREKSDQHVTRFLHSVRVWPSIIRILCSPRIATFCVVTNRVKQGHCSREKGFMIQSTTWWLINPWVRTQFLSYANHWSSGGGQNQSFVDNRLLDLLGPCLRCAIGMLNTYSRGTTHRFLTDTGGGYNLGSAGVPHHSPWPSKPTVLCFPCEGPTQSPV